MVFRYYRDPQNDDQAAGPGLQIEIPAGDDRFHGATVATLDAIYATPTGKIIIDTLVGSGKSVKIQKTATRGNSCDVGAVGLNSVASELADPNMVKIGPKTKAAFNRLTERRKHRWLAVKINNTPFYQLKGEPPTQGKYELQPSAAITEGDVEDWFEGGVDFERNRPQDDKQHIANSIICALEGVAQDGPGSDAAITFNADPNFQMNTDRPMGIGLAHELIHAYWSALGKQVGWTIDHNSTVMFEHKCVGLGHWDDRLDPGRVCENQVRSEWFGNTAGLFDMSDHVNRKNPGRRDLYSSV
jgi:hypothetical protein